jgi:hypothetical protein
MVFGYDIFRRLHDGSAMWVATVPNLDEAEKEIQKLARESRDGCFTRNAANGQIDYHPGAVMPAPAQISQPPNAGDMKYAQ